MVTRFGDGRIYIPTDGRTDGRTEGVYRFALLAKMVLEFRKDQIKEQRVIIFTLIDFNLFSS